MTPPSCPSRKFPWKHGLGLYLLKAAEPGLFNSADEPQWVSDWLGSRQARQEKKVENATAANTQDPAIAAAQARKREESARTRSMPACAMPADARSPCIRISAIPGDGLRQMGWPQPAASERLA